MADQSELNVGHNDEDDKYRAHQDYCRNIARQVMTHAVGLAMENAVSQQQQTYILRNAITTAAAKAILETSPEQALQFAKEALSGEDVVSSLSGLTDLLEKVQQGGRSGQTPDADAPGTGTGDGENTVGPGQAAGKKAVDPDSGTAAES